MATRGFLIRFIDIGLIVLFGFLMISDIESSSRVELATTSDGEDVTVERPDERSFLSVVIASDGTMSLVETRSGDVISDELSSPDALERALLRLVAADGNVRSETVVLIEPHEDSPVQFTVDVMDVCDRLSLAKSLQVDVDFEDADRDLAPDSAR